MRVSNWANALSEMTHMDVFVYFNINNPTNVIKTDHLKILGRYSII